MLQAKRSHKLVTLEEYIISMQNRYPEATGDLSQLLRDIALSGKIISQEINRTVIRDSANPEGISESPAERMKRLEEFASGQINFALKRSGIVSLVVTEESEQPLSIAPDGKYIVVLDPLDGTFNIEINASISTIFSIYRRKSRIGTQPDGSEVLQAGIHMLASGYLIYGSSIILVFTVKDFGVSIFTLDESLGEFFLAIENIRIPDEGKIFSMNTSYFHGWNDGVKKYYALMRGQGDRPGLSYRYIGSLVADVHRTLLEGGIFLFPTNQFFPDGKLKLMYQCNPLAFIIEQAGGRASAMGKRIMNINPSDIHQTTPIMLGSVKQVLEAERLLQN